MHYRVYYHTDSKDNYIGNVTEDELLAFIQRKADELNGGSWKVIKCGEEVLGYEIGDYFYFAVPVF